MEITGEPFGEEMECAICKDSMGTKSFSATDELEVENVHRLSCHHAFHSSCLISSFRINQTLACPLCRNTGSPNTGGRERRHTVQHGNMEITITHTEGEEEIDEYQDMTQFLRKIQKSPVRNARKTSKVALKKYNLLRDKLRHEKKKCIQAALVNFRDVFRKEFRDTQNALRASLKQEWEEEKKVCLEKLGDAYRSKPWFDLHKLLSTGIQFKDEMSGRKNDPWNASFWYA
jgi:hypothetical protein